MNFDEAKAMLGELTRYELRDHAFGDAEVGFYDFPGEVPKHKHQWTTHRRVDGHYSGTRFNLDIYDEKGEVIATFEGKEAAELMNCGKAVIINRNDTAGPDEFTPGYIMHGLTREGVKEELVGLPFDPNNN
ncbi:hypothetical protein CL614_00935 [archaeon]|nr:hypothetical protein [archaeon]|tara:strand:+ start:917 stop:1309 length:393 start_codon:yes stop_codon:yes gene_type:complete